MTWRPAPPADGREPRPLGPAVDRYVRRFGGGGSAALGSLFSDWENAVGPQVAAHTRPISLSGGTLVVAVDEPAWATQIRFLSTELLGRLAMKLGPGSVTAIDVRVRR